MRSFTLTVIVTALALFVVLSKAPPSTGNTCTSFVNFDLTAALNAALGTSIPDIFGNINQCLCVSGIPGMFKFFESQWVQYFLYYATAFVASSVIAQLAVALTGETATETALTTIVSRSVDIDEVLTMVIFDPHKQVDTNSEAKSCTYPANSAPACSQTNLCGFTVRQLPSCDFTSPLIILPVCWRFYPL